MTPTDRLVRKIYAVIPVLLVSLAAHCCFASGVAAFRACIATSNTTCQLNAGTYRITTSTTLAPINDSGPDYQPFVVSGTGDTITGTLSGSALATTLLRNDTSCTPACTYSLMSLQGSVQSVTIENFIFDGNRYIWVSPSLNCSTPQPAGTVRYLLHRPQPL